MQDKAKKILSVLALFIFLSVVYLIGYFSNTKKNSLDNLLSKISSRGQQIVSNIFKKNGSGYGGLIKSEVVQEESSVVDVVDKVSPAVVSVVVKTYGFDYFNGPSSSESGIGTGFIIDPKGLILTNSHVVDNPDGEYSVVMKDGTTYDVKKVHLDTVQDVAILEIDAKNLPTVSLGDSDQLKVGQRAIAIGNALGRFQNTVTVGVVSGLGRAISASGSTTINNYDSVIQTDAALNPGNSGGPLLNSMGQVIGMNVATTPGADNISFAIPVNTLKPLLETFLKEGRLIRPFLGVNYVMVTKEIAELRRLPEGAFITRVYADTPADKAQLKRGDIITAIDGKGLSSTSALGSFIAKYKVGETLNLSVDRNGKQLTLKAVLAETQDQQK